ncbi:MAG TPA: 3-dehydroquinate synthase [Rhodospirillales bacterium]|nr:3-dehydroquinate synthase [Rhodospirillales bacterium]
MTKFECINVALGERSYDIIIGGQLLNTAGDFIKSVIRSDRVIIVTDQNVAPLYLIKLTTSLEMAGISVRKIILPSGEQTKSIGHFEKLTDEILAMKVDRNVALIALGGGVIGDLTGYAAASILRGIDFVQVPTTLLSQVDSSVGGKTGINSRHGKNLIGAFYQPRLVIADIDVLDSLPKREILAGYAEIAKYGLINNIDFFAWLEEFGSELCEGNKEYRRKAVFVSCKSKAEIITKDETEQNIRALLNLGHTFGHALETETGFSNKLLHGESISIGICLAFDLSFLLGLCSKSDVKRTRNHFATIGLPTNLSEIDDINWNTETLLNHMLSDKKTKNGEVNFILTKGIGKSFVARNINMKDVHIVVEQAIQQR